MLQRIEVTGRQGRRCKQLLGDLKGNTKVLKEESLDITVGRVCFGRDYGPKVRQIVKMALLFLTRPCTKTSTCTCAFCRLLKRKSFDFDIVDRGFLIPRLTLWRKHIASPVTNTKPTLLENIDF